MIAHLKKEQEPCSVWVISRIGCFDSNQSESFSGFVSLSMEIWKIQNWYKKSLLAGPLLNESVQWWTCMKWKSLCERVSGYLHDWVVKEGLRRSWCLGPELEWKGFLARLVHESSLRQLQWAASVISSSSDRTPPPPWRTSILLNLGFKWWMSWKSLHPIAES